MSFQTRWCITGTLTTVTPLHIGSGTTNNEHEKLRVEDEEGERGVDVTAVALDAQDQPYIPGSTLKGNLRAWLQTRTKCSHLLNNVFGNGDEEKGVESQGGKAEFWNVLIKEPLKNPEHPPSYWHEKQQVGVEVGVTIDRITRTAREQRLFYHEIVPPNVCFEIRITGKGLCEDEIALLLAGLNGFNDKQQRISLGSGNSGNKGLMDWNLEEIKRLDEKAAQNWIAEGASGMWDSALKKIEHVKPLLDKSNILIYAQSNQPTLKLHFQLTFDSPFLVNDPALFVQGETPNHQPRHDHQGKAILPSRSLRGAIRSQAERIIRTIDETKNKNLACLIDDVESACKPIEKYEELEKKLCLACQLFGATGWQSPIKISDFTLVKANNDKFEQEFVAIDRFTGGGAEHLKFNAKSVYKPTFEGNWTVDLQRIKPWGLGLLALVIRDLIEGDVTFGYGAAKGYGYCHAKLQAGSINTLPNGEDYPTWKEFALNPELSKEWQGNEAILPEVRDLINDFVKAFQKKCK
jgi:CRISPR/Cas system CSM-associated protein Csm3 (group 7 of RAMP superfamily)